MKKGKTLKRFASWIVESRLHHDKDGACAQCYPEGEFLIKDFLCIKHTADLVLLAPATKGPKAPPEQLLKEVGIEPWWTSMWVRGPAHPNRFDTCKLCNESYPSVLNILLEHSESHLK